MLFEKYKHNVNKTDKLKVALNRDNDKRRVLVDGMAMLSEKC